MDYFPDDFILMVDESHVTLPQVRGMYAGDRSRKDSLVTHGFRLPSAYDNRPLNFDEFMNKINQAVFVSATPAKLEKELSSETAEQPILTRKTSLKRTTSLKRDFLRQTKKALHSSMRNKNS